MLYLQALWQPEGNRFAFSHFGKHVYVQARSTASSSIASSLLIFCCLCFCSTGKPRQKSTNGFLSLGEGILEVSYWHALRVGIRTWLALMKFEDLKKKGSHVVGLITVFNMVTDSKWQKTWTLQCL